MAERFRSGQSRLNMYFGTLICSTVPKARITDISFPELDGRFIIIRAEDIPGVNEVAAFDGAKPILTGAEISCKGQPVLAIFGPDYESVTIAARETVIRYDETLVQEGPEEGSRPLPEPLELFFGEGDAGAPAGEEERLIQTTVSSQHRTPQSFMNVSCSAWQEGGKMHIETKTQWPEMVKRNVARAANLPEESVIVHTIPTNCRHDEYLFMPTIMAAIASIAVLKTGIGAEIKTQTFSSAPAITFQRSTVCTKEGKPVRETVIADVDQGAYLFASAEMQRQIMVGLIPNYPLEAFYARINIHTSPAPSAAFFGTLGYSEALADTEYHAGTIATESGIDPLQWKSQYLTGKRRFTDYLPAFDLSVLDTLANEIATQSDYGRKWNSFELQRGDMSLIPFCRGIGIASGVSIAGFSSTRSRQVDYQARLTWTEKNNLTINTSLPTEGNTNTILKQMVKSELNLSDEHDVIILDRDNSSLDSGPDVLHRTIGKLPKQLISGCRRLIAEKLDHEPPISITFSTDDKLSPCEFENSGYMAVITEVRIDNVTFSPFVEEVWAAVTVGHTYNADELRSKLILEIIQGLKDAGAVFHNDSKRPFTVHLSIHEDNSDNLSSLEEAARGLARASFALAVKQCASELKLGYPITAEGVEFALHGKGEEK